MLNSDRSIIFKETLLDAALKNEFGFKEQDILPLFVKYQSKRQILIDIISFLTYVVQLPTQFYLRRLHRRKLITESLYHRTMPNFRRKARSSS